MRVWVGIDDTDSPKGMCTTYLAGAVIEEIGKNLGKILGFPRLIRLNPTIPYKTRGNGAVSILLDVDDDKELIEIIDTVIANYAMLDDVNTNPGAVIVNEKVAGELSWFADKAIKGIVRISDVYTILEKHSIPFVKYKKGRGLIGALASATAKLNDWTFELLAYRQKTRFGKKRQFFEDDFYDIDYEFYPLVFDTVDWMNGIVTAVPNSPCPVLFGLRGEDPKILEEAVTKIESEPVDKYFIFITNHATDMHIIDAETNGVQKLENYHSYKVRGKVTKSPYVITGGHVFFEMETKYGKIKCVAFEPTKQFRSIVRMLRAGDEIVVWGSMKRDTINLEKIKIEKLNIFSKENPRCPKCGKRMESAGRGKGFRCRNCKTYSKSKIIEKIERKIDVGYYEVPPSARRHLSMPLIRMKVGKKHVFR